MLSLGVIISKDNFNLFCRAFPGLDSLTPQSLTGHTSTQICLPFVKHLQPRLPHKKTVREHSLGEPELANLISPCKYSGRKAVWLKADQSSTSESELSRFPHCWVPKSWDFQDPLPRIFAPKKVMWRLGEWQ